MKVTQLAKSFNTTPDTVRHYTKLGLLQPKKSPSNGYKQYDREQQNRLRFILTARHLGFNLQDIQTILAETDQQKTACPLVRDIIEQRYQQVQQQFLQSQRLLDVMKQAMNYWQTLPDKAPDSHSVCHLIEAFSDSFAPEQHKDI
jgi:DNA-binding transcriptional MerR regulator